MKKYLIVLLSIVSFSLSSQRTFQGKATYMSKRTVDMNNFGKMSEQQKKQMNSEQK